MIALLAQAWGMMPADLRAAQADEAVQQSEIVQRSFASPDEAVKALQVAAETKDKEAVKAIFGPEVKGLLTGDDVQDANNSQKFAAVMAQGYTLVKEGDDKVTIEVGLNNWPMPIPLVKKAGSGSWYFDTLAGKEEIIDRHIGKDELHAIGICRAYVTAQQQYAALNPRGSQGIKYAQRLKSTPGKRDGLYWPSAVNEAPSPFGALVAEANAQGYLRKSFHPFHGYFFRILTRQAGSASGGFALVAYPQHWGQSGIMTFVVNQDGKVFQKDLGEKTFQLASAMKEYGPDSSWTLVQDEGVLDTVSNKGG